LNGGVSDFCVNAISGCFCPTILNEYDKVARQCAAEQVDYPRYLPRLTELELLDRDRRAIERRIRQARFR